MVIRGFESCSVYHGVLPFTVRTKRVVKVFGFKVL